MKVVLINPASPYLANDASYPPSGLMYLASAIEESGHSVTIVDLTGMVDWQNEVHNLDRLDADLFGITYVTPNFKIVQTIANLLPKDKPIIIGGVHPTFLPEDTYQNIRCNAVVRGEAEIAIKEVINDLEKGNLKKIYQGGMVPVDKIPKPARHLVNLHKYRPGGEFATPIYTSRGCPFNCAFCAKITGRTVRAFSIERVISEVEDAIRFGFRNIVFGDDNITIQKSRLKELLRALKPLKIKFRLNQDARSKSIDDDILALAAEVGCYEISFGIESGSQKILDLMNKKVTVEENILAIKKTKSYGIIAKAYFVVNFPGETKETVAETLRFAEIAKPDKWLLSAFVPLPGSDTFHHPEKYGIKWLSPNWEDYYLVGKDVSFKPCFTTEEMSIEKQIQLHSMLYKGLKEILG